MIHAILPMSRPEERIGCTHLHHDTKQAPERLHFHPHWWASQYEPGSLRHPPERAFQQQHTRSLPSKIWSEYITSIQPHLEYHLWEGALHSILPMHQTRCAPVVWRTRLSLLLEGAAAVQRIAGSRRGAQRISRGLTCPLALRLLSLDVRGGPRTGYLGNASELI